MLGYEDIIKKYKFDVKKEEIGDLLNNFKTLMDILTKAVKNSKIKEDIDAFLQENTVTIKNCKNYYRFLLCMYEQERLFEIDQEIRELEQKIKNKKAEYRCKLINLSRISFSMFLNGVPVLPNNPRYGLY